MHQFSKHLWIFLFLFLGVQSLSAQTDGAEETEKKKIRFNGLGRATMQQTELGGTIKDLDTTTVESLTDGEFLLDLAINATPNEQTEIQTILRLRNEFGGFFGAGVTVEVRELWARGIIANVVKYRVGDMDLSRTPYTLFTPAEEGAINEAALFRPQKELVNYEQFYHNPNERRLQGAKLDFGLDFTKGIDELDATAFIARIRGTDFFTTPTRFVGGGHVDLLKLAKDTLGFRGKVGLNYVNTWDDRNSGEATTGIRNDVVSINFDFTVFEKENIAIQLLGETGQSRLSYKADSISLLDKDDTFLDIGFAINFKPQNLRLTASFVDIGPDFFSVGAQSKRVDLDRDKTYYNRIGNNRDVRMPTLFDLAKDRALYTFQLSDRLMAYDPRFSNTMPYGLATPNRRGLRLGLDYKDEKALFDAKVDVALMNEIRGQGTQELKQFALVRAQANLNIHTLAGWKRNCQFTFGYQFENTNRGGLEVEQVDLQSHLLDLGLEAELFDDFSWLVGTKILSSQGSDYIPLIASFNEIQDFPGLFVVDDTEMLLGTGFRYDFKEGIYITAQYQHFALSRENDPSNDYNLSQFFVLYQMNF